MACTKPKLAYKQGLTENGKQKLVFKWQPGFTKNQEQRLPCGKCLSCKLDYAKEWALRLTHEASLHEKNCFITLTYNDENLPEDKNLHLPHLQKFWKRLRNYPDIPSFRYFAVGEYGTNGERGINPHYHAAIFGLDPALAPIIQECWGLGHTMCADINKDTASYIVGYTLKKLTNKRDPRLNGRSPEFSTSSKKGGGIGIKGLEKIVKQIKEDKRIDIKYPLHEINYGGYKMPLGRYLTDKMAEMLGLEQENFERKENYREEIIYNALNKAGVFKENIVEVDEQKRKKQKKRHAIRQSTKLRRLH